MADLVDAAEKRLAALEAEAKKLRAFIASAKEVMPFLTGHPTTPADLFTEQKPVDNPLASEIVKRTRVNDNPKPSVLVPAMIEILRAHGKPMSRRELHWALHKRGLEVRGTDPLKALGTIIWRARDQIVSLEGFGYWPLTDHYEPAAYDGDI